MMADKLSGAVLWFICFFGYLFMLIYKSPSKSVVWENAVVVFCCEAPLMFCGPRNLTRISNGMGGVDNGWIFIFG